MWVSSVHADNSRRHPSNMPNFLSNEVDRAKHRACDHRGWKVQHPDLSSSAMSCSKDLVREDYAYSLLSVWARRIYA